MAECIVIEDAANGVTAAKAAGIYCIAYASPHSAGQDLHQADRIIRHFNELSAATIEGWRAEPQGRYSNRFSSARANVHSGVSNAASFGPGTANQAPRAGASTLRSKWMLWAGM